MGVGWGRGGEADAVGLGRRGAGRRVEEVEEGVGGGGVRGRGWGRRGVAGEGGGCWGAPPPRDAAPAAGFTASAPDAGGRRRAPLLLASAAAAPPVAKRGACLVPSA